MYVQFSDATQTVIIATFAGPQNASAYPNQGTVTASDARWATFYAVLPASAQAALTPPTTPAAPTLAQQAATALGAGITLTLAGTMTLAATLFPTDPVTQTKLAAVVTTINAAGAFPGGAASFPMKDATGAWHVLTVNQYKEIAGAISSYVAALNLIIDGNPLSATALPAAALTVDV